MLPAEAGNAVHHCRAAGAEIEVAAFSRFRATGPASLRVQSVVDFRRSLGVLEDELRRISPDVLLINGLANPHGLLAAGRLGLPTVVQLLDTRTPPLLTRGLKPVVRRHGNALMYVGRETLLHHRGYQELMPSINFLPPVDLRKWPTALPQWDGSGTVRLVSAGNRNPQKGLDVLLRAVNSLRQDFDVHLMVAGAVTASQPDYARGLDNLAKELGWTRSPFVDVGRDVPRVMAPGDIFVHAGRPSGESISVTLLEAMAMGKPCVVTPVGGNGRVVRSAGSGIVADGFDWQSIATAIRSLLQLSVEELRMMGRNARTFAESNATIGQCFMAHKQAVEIAVGSAL